MPSRKPRKSTKNCRHSDGRNSNHCRINQFATKAKVLASSGARLGHTANQLRHKTTEKYKYIVLQTGDNNYDPTINIDKRNKDNTDKTLKEQATKYCKQTKRQNLTTDRNSMQPNTQRLHNHHH